MFFGSQKNAPPKNAPDAQAGMTSGAPAQAVFEANTDDFEDRVLRASMDQPVIAYFTAPWCGPCQQLGPLLERAVLAAGGKVLMAKINLDENQQLAAALRIQSVPTIFGFFQGRPVDAFQGAVPESQIKAFIQKLLEAARQAQPDALDIPEALKAAAQALAQQDFATAQGIYSHILQADPVNAQAYTGLVRTLIAAGMTEQAKELVDGAPEDIANAPAFAEAKTALELAAAKPAGGDLGGLRSALEKDENNHQLRFDLACALFADGAREEAIEHMLEIMQCDREWNEEAARKQVLKFFEAMGPSDPLTIQSRRKLSSILFS